jgi:large subunit ribosomal protein L6
MSKIGNKPIFFSDDTSVKYTDNHIEVKGKKGCLELNFLYVTLNIVDNYILIKPINNDKKNKKFHGLYRSLINNMIVGVNEGFQKTLILKGVGYNAKMVNNKIVFNLGFSHTIEKDIPQSIKVNIEKQGQKIIISSISKHDTGLFAAQIRSLKVPEPYLGKGIRYENEVIIKKVGKTNTK